MYSSDFYIKFKTEKLQIVFFFVNMISHGIKLWIWFIYVLALFICGGGGT